MFSKDLEKLLPHLRAFARALCHDVILADDLVQDACLKAWDARDSFDPNKGSLKTWLFRILRNEFYMKKRRSWRSVNTDIENIERALITDCALQSSADLGRMMRAIFTLNDAQRDAFILIVAAGFTYEEAGHVCDCAPGTIKSRVNRAREKILSLYHSNNSIPDIVIDEPETKPHSAIDLIHHHIDRIQSAQVAA
jgi:RNA polymerase sigma-70 factor (ECF subfamily)